MPLPGYEDKVIYSWFDACIGYVSITACYTDQREKWWRNPDDVSLYQFIGKDNVVYHSVIFPATQLGTQDPWTKLYHLSTTDYLTYEGGKFSKGRVIGVFGDSAQKTGVPSDVWRFFLLSIRPETGHSEFTWDALISANNNLLLKNLGNFVSRVLKFVNSGHYDNIVPDWSAYHESAFEVFKEEVNVLLAQYIRDLDAVNLVHLLAALLGPYLPQTASRSTPNSARNHSRSQIAGMQTPSSRIMRSARRPICFAGLIRRERKNGAKCLAVTRQKCWRRKRL